MFYISDGIWKCLMLVMICTSTASPTCRSGAFHCDNGRCICALWRCDGLDDCGDHSDEENCVGHAALLYRSTTNVLMLDLETLEKTVIASGFSEIIAVDYDYARGVVLCTDTLNKSIYKIKLENGTSSLNFTNNSNIETVVKDQLMESQGIAVDWIHGNVYWTDDGRKTISVATLDGRWIRLLFHKNIARPRSIVVNPLEGWFFWTDFQTPAKIERAGMDGSERSVIISEDLYWPNGLAIDFVTKKVFWVDVGYQTLSSSDYDGSNRRLLLSLISIDSDPFALDVFQDWLYWSDWSSGIIKKANKFTGNNLTIAASETMSRTDLKVYHIHKQPKGINYCDNMNSACSHFCLPAPQVTEESSKFACFCPDGMMLGDDKKICVPDIPTCQSDEFACRDLECIPGSRRCDGIRDCKDDSDEENCVYGTLLFSNSTHLLMLDLETQEETIVASGDNSIGAIDYDYARGIVLWSDPVNERICRINLQNRTSILNSPNGSNIDTVVQDKRIFSTGIAVDWIHGNVYWTDRDRKTISVATLDDRIVRLLFQESKADPHAIVLNPLEGWLFWTDMGRHPKIERAGMDGSERSVIISEDISRPNGLAIDFATKKLFFLDSGLHTLSSSDYDGSNRRLLLSSSSEVGFAFGLDVFEDWLYWSDRPQSSASIKRVNKFSGKNLKIVATELGRVKSFMVYHSKKQPKGINYCDNINSTCSHFCLPAPQVTKESPKFTCFCPAGMTLGDDKKKCLTDIPTPCRSDEFACDNLECIRGSWRCDGDRDCTDGSDEENCDVCEIREKTCTERDMDCEADRSTNEGFKCVCKKGDEIKEDGTCRNVCEIKKKTCREKDMDCETDRTTNEGFKCVCKKGDEDNGDGTCRKNAALLFNSRKDILLLDLETNEKTIIASGLDRIGPIDYDYAREVVLWSDTLNKSIYKISFQNRTSILNSPNGSNIDTVVKDERIYSSGIAVDWIHGNVYWTDIDKKTISVATQDGSVVKVLFSKSIRNPTVIVVNPLEGWIFWVDKRPARIERAGMDGSERSVIISEDISRPIGLALDYGTKKLFFSDFLLHTLSSSNYDGSNRRIILISSSESGIAFGLDVFEDWLYWNMYSRSIKKVNKFTGTNLTIVATDIIPYSDFKVYHSNKQPKGINHCDNTNSTCSHFCLPAPHVSEESPKFTCFCPDGMVLGDNKKTCVTS